MDDRAARNVRADAQAALSDLRFNGMTIRAKGLEKVRARTKGSSGVMP